MTNETTTSSPVESQIVYIRTVALEDIPEEARAQIGDAALYAIHDTQGKRLAIVANREVAFVVARQNAMTPVSVH